MARFNIAELNIWALLRELLVVTETVHKSPYIYFTTHMVILVFCVVKTISHRPLYVWTQYLPHHDVANRLYLMCIWPGCQFVSRARVPAKRLLKSLRQSIYIHETPREQKSVLGFTSTPQNFMKKIWRYLNFNLNWTVLPIILPEAL
jgi:hypothetical protein